MISHLSRSPRWDILQNFYRDFDNDRKRDCVEKWKKEMPQSRLERDLFETKIHTEFLNDRYEKLNKEFRWTNANMKKLITLDLRFRELHRCIARTFEATKRDVAALTAQNHKWYRCQLPIGRSQRLHIALHVAALVFGNLQRLHQVTDGIASARI